MLVHAFPERIIGVEPPGDGLGVGERGFLPVVIFDRFLEVHEIIGLGFFERAGEGLDRTLVAAELAFHRA
ncbi:hypothetical protein D3C83_287320 [compost metagenome]